MRVSFSLRHAVLIPTLRAVCHRTLLDDFILREQAQKASAAQKMANAKTMRAWAEQEAQRLLSVLNATNTADDALGSFTRNHCHDPNHRVLIIHFQSVEQAVKTRR